jgi:hypothetical protein
MQKHRSNGSSKTTSSSYLVTCAEQEQKLSTRTSHKGNDLKFDDDKKTWGIIGLGWLGTALSEGLLASGRPHWGTRRDSFSFEAVVFPKTPCDLLLVNTPPLIHISTSEFSGRILIGPSSRLIFVSSTGVYGKNSGRVTEATKPLPNTASGHWLVETEHFLRERFKDKLTIVRPGGLIGGSRHPVYHLSGRSDIPGGDSPINLIHRLDLIAILLALETRPDITLINTVAPYHPQKKDYYCNWAENLKLDKLRFSNDETSDRIVESEVIDDLYQNWICPRLDAL